MSAILIPPALATRVDRVPTGPEWLHEPKLDGYRIQCHLRARASTLLTRSGLDWSARFPAVVAATRELAGRRDMVLDGEIVMPSRRGASAFQSLQRAVKEQSTARVVYWVFDLLEYDGLDLRSLPLTERRMALQRLLSGRGGAARVRMTRELRGAPDSLLARACAVGGEGIISKRRDGAYPSGRSGGWLKIKCGQQDEFVVVGSTAPRGSRQHIGALLLATRHEAQGALRFAGRVGSGFDAPMLAALAARLVRRDGAPDELTFVGAVPRNVQWVEPDLVINASFAEWTVDGLLRQATFGGIREDKPVTGIQREQIMATPGTVMSHGERLVFPEAGIHKRDVADYLVAVSPLMLPHITGRPLSLLRCPSGAHAQCFFQKHWKPTRGATIATRTVAEADGSNDAYAVVTTTDDLLALAQMNVLEIHAWGSRFPSVEKPDRIILDLDPGPDVSWADVCGAARQVRDLLAAHGLESWVKLTGGKGLHVTVPVSGATTWDQVSLFGKLIATRMASDEPRRFTSTMAKRARTGKIFIDWMRNNRGSTAVAPWSIRARTGGPIAMPLSWDELDGVPRGDLMTIPDVIDFLRTSPDDPWSDLLTKRQRITTAMVHAIGAGVTDRRSA